MDKKQIAELLLARLPKLREQLLRRYNAIDVVEDSFSYATEKLMVNPSLFNEDRGCFNTYLFNITSNYCQKELARLSKLVCLDAPIVEIESYYDVTIPKGLGYEEWLAETYPVLSIAMRYDPDMEPDPYAEVKLLSAVKTFAETLSSKKLAAVNKKIDLDILFYVEPQERNEWYGIPRRATVNAIRDHIKKTINKKFINSEKLASWSTQLVQNKLM